MNLGFLIVKKLPPIFKLIAYYIVLFIDFFSPNYFTLSALSSHYMVFFKYHFSDNNIFLSKLDSFVFSLIEFYNNLVIILKHHPSGIIQVC